MSTLEGMLKAARKKYLANISARFDLEFERLECVTHAFRQHSQNYIDFQTGPQLDITVTISRPERFRPGSIRIGLTATGAVETWWNSRDDLPLVHGRLTMEALDPIEVVEAVLTKVRIDLHH